jgi:hypothetical protein
MKTQNEIFPILVSKCESLNWKIRKDYTATKNLESLMKKVSRLESKIKTGSLPPQEEHKTRQTLSKAMFELGQSIPSLKTLEKCLRSESTTQLEKAFASKETPILWAEMLTNLKNSEKVRKSSIDYSEAWREIEGNHFVKISLYNIEIERRGLK